jgi:hypothetical protein
MIREISRLDFLSVAIKFACLRVLAFTPIPRSKLGVRHSSGFVVNNGFTA